MYIFLVMIQNISIKRSNLGTISAKTRTTLVELIPLPHVKSTTKSEMGQRIEIMDRGRCALLI